MKLTRSEEMLNLATLVEMVPCISFLHVIDACLSSFMSLSNVVPMALTCSEGWFF